ncbi:MAG: hypothetical protein GVY21_01430 [Gammaproteobacteria bacterium]|nr:hypothetical protein [Gammaproteobacteria bacterium]
MNEPPRDALFDLAMTRALAYARRTRALERSADVASLRRELELWALRTRFASRVDLDAVAARLFGAPSGEVHWRGGPDGGWRAGPPPRP